MVTKDNDRCINVLDYQPPNMGPFMVPYAGLLGPFYGYPQSVPWLSKVPSSVLSGYLWSLLWLSKVPAVGLVAR